MTSTVEIRDALKSGPMKPSAIADHLGVTDQDERKALYQAIRQMAAKQRGIEQLDDGSVSIIPGWKPAPRGRNAAAAEPATKTRSRRAVVPIERKRKPAAKGKAGKVSKLPAEVIEAAVARTVHAQAAAPVIPGIRSAAPDGNVSVPRKALRTLIAFIMGSDRSLNVETRAAVLKSIEAAA